MTEERHSSLDLHDFHLHDSDGSGPQRRAVLRRAVWATVIVVLLLAAGGVRSLLARSALAREVAATTAEQEKIFVVTTSPRPSNRDQKLVLPGSLQGMVESPVYARTGGYLLRWHKDIGATVRKGDLLAEIDTPEIERQLDAAIATRDQATASLDLARSSVARWETLRKQDAVSQQELDERRSGFSQAEANLAAADANVKRLREQAGFNRLVAPFDGIITRRNVNVGDLIDPGNGGLARALFTVAQIDTLRVYVFVPQSFSRQVKVGQEVKITQQELIGREFVGKVARTAGALDPATRTLQVEVNTPNAAHLLMPGSYVQVAFPMTPGDALVVPTNTLMFRAEGPQAAVVNAQGKVNLKSIVIGENYGRAIQVINGLLATDRLIVNPPDSIAEGDSVIVRELRKKPTEPAADKSATEKGSATERAPAAGKVSGKEGDSK